MRVDDYFKYHNGKPVRLGDRVRERDGRHVWVVNAVVSNKVHATSEDTKWKTVFERDEIELEGDRSSFLSV